MKATLDIAWTKRHDLYEQGDDLWQQGDDLYEQGDDLRKQGYDLRKQGQVLWKQGLDLRKQGQVLWIAAVEGVGISRDRIQWDVPEKGDCTVAGLMVFFGESK